MTKAKVEKILVISFIGLIITFLVGLGGNIVLKAGLPVSTSRTEINFEKRLHSIEENLQKGYITRHEYDSLAELLGMQKKQSLALQNENHNPDKMPDWVTKLGIVEPDGMKFDQVFSDFTSVDDPTEGFNSVSLVYTGSYEKAIEEAERIATKAKLSAGGIFRAKGSPARKAIHPNQAGISYLNYSLGNTDQDFLISVQVEPSGRMIIMVTDNKQLNERLLVYEPLNNRQNSAAKRKKQ